MSKRIRLTGKVAGMSMASGVISSGVSFVKGAVQGVSMLRGKIPGLKGKV